ncbi:MAG TPA: exodeoxyribonuclease VII large subunit [Candidatus Binataceae bacterium]|jgi:exodeoxyribonuclease VII large subunit|nr:exodeoxyribonuclease VII large subunit [Candidatus Binataceae bacterium]
MAGQLEFTLRTRPRRVALSVTQLVRLVRDAVEVHLDEYWVAGEISNARLAPSNHFYFTLKDARSSISAVMFNTAYRRLRFRVNDGMDVMVHGRISLYEARGTLQFYAEELEPRGLGALQLAFDQLKQRLSKEGLFDQERKRLLPFLPGIVGLVTALGGAGLRDMLRILRDRRPNLHVIVRPARVQGEAAAAEIAAAITDLNLDGRAEVIIVGRGGGSLEDLWAFNEEVVARAIADSRIPIVSAVGHEVDYTIADFVADQRAPTPTAAAQLVVPDHTELQKRIAETVAVLESAMANAIAVSRRNLAHLGVRVKNPRSLLRQVRQRLDDATGELHAATSTRLEESRRVLRELAQRLHNPLTQSHERRLLVTRLAIRLAQTMDACLTPIRLRLSQSSARLNVANLYAAIAARRLRIMTLEDRLHSAARVALDHARYDLSNAAGRLDAVSPLRVLERGYAVVFNQRNGQALLDAAGAEVGDDLEIRLSRGRLQARTTAARES